MYQMQKDTAKRSERLKSKEIQVDALTNAVNQKMTSIITREHDLFQDKMDFEMEKELFNMNTKKIQSYQRTTEDVELSERAIDSEVNRLKSTSSASFASRFSVFVINVKKIMTKAITELHAYKYAFKRFWKFGSKEFRTLATLMERNNCQTYEDFNSQNLAGKLDFQQRKATEIKHKYKSHHKDDDYSYSR